MAEKKSFKSIGANDNLILKTTELPKVSKADKKSKPDKEKKEVGRPKTINYERTQINVKINKELFDKWEQIKIIHGSNLTNYIEKLIEKDMNQNYDKYLEMVDTLKSMNNM